MKKVTIATVKSFIRKNLPELEVRVKSKFNGMSDSVEAGSNGFLPATKSRNPSDNDQGISGVWFVGRSRDYTEAFEGEGRVGFQVSNSCGSFIVAKKA